MPDLLIEVEHITYTYPGQKQPTLQDVSLQVRAGEWIALIGSNGSGKTTLARHLNALLLPEQGRVLVNGLDTRQASHHLAIRSQVGMVFQSPADQMVATIVEEDVAFGPENMALPAAEIRERVRAALAAVDMSGMHLRPPHLLSAGQMQRVALAGVLAMEPSCILFDETTAMLDPVGRRKVLEIMHRLHDAGLTIITITHFMDDVLEAGRAVVLHQGRLVLDAPPGELFANPARLAEWGLDLPPAGLLAGELRQVFPGLTQNILTRSALLDALPEFTGAAVLPPPLEPAESRPALIAVEELEHTYLRGDPLEYHALRGVNLHVTDGQAHGIMGATGSGKSTLLLHLNGLLRPQVGRVRVADFDLNDPNVSLRAVCQRVGLVFQQPEQQIFEQYVGDEISFGPRQMGLSREAVRERVRTAMMQVGLDFERDKDRLTVALSGGEKRKVALASTLALQPSILVLDEPTAGLAPMARRWLHEQLLGLKQKGMTLVISSHQMEDMALLADRLMVLRSGQDVLTGAVADVYAQVEFIEQIGMGVPLVIEVAAALRQKGWPLSTQITRSETLLVQLRRCIGSAVL